MSQWIFWRRKNVSSQIACCWFHVSMCLETGALSIKKHLLLGCFRQSNAICICRLYILVMSIIAHMCATHLDQENRCTPEMMFAKMMREREGGVRERVVNIWRKRFFCESHEKVNRSPREKPEAAKSAARGTDLATNLQSREPLSLRGCKQDRNHHNLNWIYSQNTLLSSTMYSHLTRPSCE